MKRLILSTALLVGVLLPVGAAQAAPPDPVNLAYGAEAAQSSTYQGGLAARAVDGNSHGVFGHASVSHTGRDAEAWWQVDLGEIAEITEVVLWNRTDCCSERLSDFHVLVSDQPFTSNDLQEAQAQPGVSDFRFSGAAGEETRIAIGRTARFVRVQLEGRNYLSLAEVEVLSLLDAGGQPEPAAGLDADVFVDGLDAFAAPGPVVAPDGDALFTYQVTNTGDQTLYGLYLWQNGVGEVPCPTAKMYAGETVTCEVTVDVFPGDHVTGVSAEAWTGSGQRISDSPDVYYRVEGSGPAGTQNVALGKAARQTEDNQSPSAHPARLAVDGDLDGDLRNGSVSMTYRIVEAYWEVDLGASYDIDTITLWNRTDCCSDRLRDFHVFVSDEPFDLDDLQYTMTQPGVLDVHHRGTAGRRADVEVGRTGRYVRIQAAYREAIVQLAEVQVWGTPAGSGGSAPPEPAPSSVTALDVQLSVDGDDADVAPGPTLTPGDTATFTYEVSNTGTGPLWAVYLWDDEFGHVDTCPAGRLDPGATIVCLVEAEVEVGRFGTRVEATAWDAAGLQAIDFDSVHYLGTEDGTVVGPALDLEAFVEGVDADAAPGHETAPGRSLAFTYEVTNVGTERLWALEIWHNGVGAADCPRTMLDVGDSITCTGGTDADAGEVVADVYANAWDAAGDRASDSDPVAYTGVTDVSGPSIRLESRVDGRDADDPPGATVLSGATATFTYEVTNTGTEELWGLWVGDREHGEAGCPTGNLEPGESVTCTITTAPSDGLHEGGAAAAAWDAAGNRVDDTDPHHYFVALPGAAVELEALVDGLNGWWQYGPRIRIGEIVTRSFVVTNTGSVPLSGIQVTDDLAGDVACPRTTLQPGATLTCAVTQYTQLGKSITFARVSAVGDGVTVTAEERLAWHVKVTSRNADISLEITVNGQPTTADGGPILAAGSTATIRYEVLNLGTWTSFYDIQIRDPQIPMSQMTCTNTQEVYLGSVVCTARVTVAEGEYRQLVVADAWSANTPKMQASGWVTWTGVP